MKDLILSNRDIETLTQSQVLVRLAGSRELTPKVQFDLAKFLKKCDPIIRSFQEVKLEILKKYCQKNSKGDPILNDDGTLRFANVSLVDGVISDQELANNAMEELLEQKTEIANCRKMKIDLSHLTTNSEVLCPFCGKKFPMARSLLSAVDMLQLECVVDFEDKNDGKYNGSPGPSNKGSRGK